MKDFEKDSVQLSFLKDQESAVAAPTVPRSQHFKTMTNNDGGHPGAKLWSFYVVVICAFAAIGGLLFGYDIGIISGVKEFQSFQTYFHHPDDVMVSWVVSAVLVGAMAGALIAGPLCDKSGRRMTIIVAGATFTVGSIIMGCAVHIWMLVAGRFIVGVGVGMASLAVPLYLAEVSPPALRGGLVSLNQLFITIGIMVSYGINIGFSGMERGWSYSLGLSGVPALILFIGMWFLPETPYWLVLKGRTDRAVAVLRRVRGPGVDLVGELAEIQESAAMAQQQKAVKWREILQRPVLKVQLIGLGLTVFQQFVGINAVIYYAPEIFGAVGFHNTAQLLATLVVGLVNVGMTVLSLWLLDWVGRRALLLWGGGVMILSMLVLAILAALDLFVKYDTLGYVAIVAVCVYIAGFAISWGPVAWLIPSEIFPLRLRGKMTTVSTFGNWVSNVVVGMAFLSLYNAITWGVFLVFSALGVLAFIFVLLCVPETKNKTLDELSRGL